MQCHLSVCIWNVSKCYCLFINYVLFKIVVSVKVKSLNLNGISISIYVNVQLSEVKL